MKIFCRNYSCPYIKFLDIPVRFAYRKHYVFLGDNDGYCMAECQKEFPGFKDSRISASGIKHVFAECMKGDFVNCNSDCLWAKEKKCTRNEILIDRIIVDDKEYWICKCKSNVFISGHTDFGRFGTEKNLF